MSMGSCHGRYGLIEHVHSRCNVPTAVVLNNPHTGYPKPYSRWNVKEQTLTLDSAARVAAGSLGNKLPRFPVPLCG